MGGGVQVVDQLGADTGLRQDEIDRRERVATVALEEREEPLIRFSRLDGALGGNLAAYGRYFSDRSGCASQIVAQRTRRLRPVVGQRSLRCIRQHEFITFFN